MQRVMRVVLPLLVVAIAALGAWWIVASRPAPEPQAREFPPPLVRVEEARARDLRLGVTTQGTVAPRSEITLVPEVSGRVVEVSPSLVAGGFFEEGQVLLALDSRDYELALARARAEVARAELLLAREEAEADVAREEWAELGDGAAGPLVDRRLQVAEARAGLDSARAALDRADLDLERTRLRAPFDGRVKHKAVDLGQFVSRGAALASIYAVDVAEIRLPLSQEQMGFAGISLDYQEDGRPGPAVILRAVVAGEEQAWTGRIVRVEGEIDPQTRLVTAVARVDDPYGRRQRRRGAPLAPGLFVEAEIEGRPLEGAVVLPRAALRGPDRVYLVDGESRLRFRTVRIAQATRQSVILTGGIEDGELVCLSPLEAAVDGMRVRLDDTAPTTTETGDDAGETRG